MMTRRRPRHGLGADAVGIGDGAQVVHARKVGAGDAASARPAAGGEQQGVVGEHQAVVQAHVPLAARDGVDAPAEVRGHVVLGEELRRTDQQTLALEAPGEVLLRQRRALVGKPGLLADERQPSAGSPCGAACRSPGPRPGRRPRSRSVRTLAQRIAQRARAVSRTSAGAAPARGAQAWCSPALEPAAPGRAGRGFRRFDAVA